jgi:hypothetical protein
MVSPEEDGIDRVRRVLALSPGNPMNATMVFVTVAFALMLVIFPAVMLAAGVGVGGTIGVALLIVAVAALCLWILATVAGGYARDLAALVGGGAWARWQIARSERDRFVARERRRFGRLALWYVVGAVAGAALLGVVVDWLAGGIFGAALLLAALLTWLLATPSASAPEATEVYVGPRGVYQLGRYTPLQGPGRRLDGAAFAPGQPAELRFAVADRYRSSGAPAMATWRPSEVRVAVPADRAAEAAALAARFRREFGLPEAPGGDDQGNG